MAARRMSRTPFLLLLLAALPFNAGQDATNSTEATSESGDSTPQGLPLTTASETLTVVRKCCPDLHVWDLATSTCHISHDLQFIVPTFAMDIYGIYTEGNLTRDQLQLQTGKVTCSSPWQLEEPTNTFKVLETGQLWVVDFEAYYELDMYCLETFAQNASAPASPHWLGAAVCHTQTPIEPFDTSKITVRKCCLHNQVYTADSSCIPRDNVTSEAWRVPLRPAGAAAGELAHVDVRQQPYADTHEVVASFQVCKRDEMGIEVHDFHVIEQTGKLYIPELLREFSHDEYCIEDFYTEDVSIPTAYICVSEAERQQLQLSEIPGCDSGNCMRKCCPFGQILDSMARKCVAAIDTYFNVTVKMENGSQKLLSDIEFLTEYPDCELQLTYEEEDVQLLEGMNLSYVSYSHEECDPRIENIITQDNYCIDQVLYPSGKVKQGAAFCILEEATAEKSDVRIIYSVFLGISDLFILISFIVYLTVPDQNKRGLNKNVKLAHSVLGRILLCFLFSMFFAYLFLIIINLFSDPIYLASKSACIGVGVCMYMFFMATFFWLNVLCFEIWWKCSRQESSSGRRWVWYQVYAWFGPITFGAISLIMDLSPSINSCYIKPNFGKYSCFFSDTLTHSNGAKWAYFFGPVAALLIADLIFFLLTVRSLLVTVQQSHKGTAQKQAKQRLKLCFKLFLVMGISWFAEIIAYQFGPSNFGYISNIFNCSQGFIVFLIFILKPKIMEAVRARLCGCCGDPKPTKLRGMLPFTSMVLTNSATTDEFSLSNQQLSLARSNVHNQISTISNSTNDMVVPPMSHHLPKHLPLSLCQSSELHAKIHSRPSSEFPNEGELRASSERDSRDSSPSSSRPSTPRTTSTRGSLSASCKSMDEVTC
ncbi:probable G-protein coupled receptor Mth-like 1 isoform X1 [Penaeus indicus]|uniref:probable G-protein coupled receptor Mth-like 1 isoform X1 n=1 Tax=Penaeus indicus TaxID=29960 RepID=UPI00300D5F11